MCAQGVVMHCTGSDFIKVTTQMKTSENNWEHRKTSKIIWHHPKNNWGPIIDDLVQFEEDFNSRTEKSWWWGGHLLRSIPLLMSGHLNFNFFKLWVRHFSTQISIMDAQIWFISIVVKLTNISLTVFIVGHFWPMSRHENQNSSLFFSYKSSPYPKLKGPMHQNNHK